MPRTLAQIKEATKFYERLVNEINIKQNEFPGIIALFKVLNNYQIEVPQSTHELLINLDSAWQSYLKTLTEASDMLEINKEEFKNNLLQQSEKFRNVIKSLLAEFLLKVPTTSVT